MVAKAYNRISGYVHNTPLLYSETLNKIVGSQVYFKMDATHKTGSFKIRGVLNHLLALKESNKMPGKIVAYSTGNHALAMAYTAKLAFLLLSILLIFLLFLLFLLLKLLFL